MGYTGVDVRSLQQLLNAHGFMIAQTGPGSVGNETTKFGSATKTAVMKLQKKIGVAVTGFFGPKTREYVNKHYLD